MTTLKQGISLVRCTSEWGRKGVEWKGRVKGRKGRRRVERKGKEDTINIPKM